MTLTIARMREILDEAMREGLSEDTEIRVAHQPQWPFEYSLDPYSFAVSNLRHDPEDDPSVPLGDPIIYLGEGRQVGYLPSGVAGDLGWS